MIAIPCLTALLCALIRDRFASRRIDIHAYIHRSCIETTLLWFLTETLQYIYAYTRYNIRDATPQFDFEYALRYIASFARMPRLLSCAHSERNREREQRPILSCMNVAASKSIEIRQRSVFPRKDETRGES